MGAVVVVVVVVDIHNGGRLTVHARQFDGPERIVLDFDLRPEEPGGDRHASVVEGFLGLLEALLADPGRRLVTAIEQGAAGPAISPAPSRAERVPSSPAERILAGVWCRLLHLDAVSVSESFYDLGGDSIMSIEMVWEARKEGLALAPADVARHQTIAALALVAAGAPVAAPVASHAAPGEEAPLALLPIQRRFFERETIDPHHWNLASLFAVEPHLDPELLGQALGEVVSRHAGLRVRFERAGSTWRQRSQPGEATTRFSRHDLSALPEAAHASEIERVAAALQGSLSLADGPLLRLAWFERGPDRSPRLLLLAHHLVVDPISITIVVDDLATAYHRFIAEENDHMWYFARFCLDYAGKIYPDAWVPLGSEAADPEVESLLVFARILLFEEVVDHFNRTMAHDQDLHPFIRAINRAHQRDEARHIAAGRHIVEELFERVARRLPAAELDPLRAYLGRYLATMIETLYNPAVYRDAGIAEPHKLRRRLLEDPGREGHHQRFLGETRQFLVATGILPGSD